VPAQSSSAVQEGEQLATCHDAFPPESRRTFFVSLYRWLPCLDVPSVADDLVGVSLNAPLAPRPGEVWFAPTFIFLPPSVRFGTA